MNDAIRILGVGGTWAKRHEQETVQWYQKGSPLHYFLLARAFSWLVGHDGRVFEWTTRINGFSAARAIGNALMTVLTLGFRKKKWLPSLVDWDVAGANLYDHVCPALFESTHWLPACVTHLWLHSHAGNVGFFACAKGLIANTFVTFCTPCRADMVATIKQARPRIGLWIEVHADKDTIQRAGEAGDGDIDLDGVRSFNELVDPDTGKTLRELGLGPDVTIVVDDGHSGLLNNPRRFYRLNQILDVTRARHGMADVLKRATASFLAPDPSRLGPRRC